MKRFLHLSLWLASGTIGIFLFFAVAEGASEALETVRSGMEAAMGPLPARDPSRPPKFEVTKTVDRGTYLRKHLILEPETGDRLPAHLYLPKGIEPGQRRAGILALHSTHVRIGKKVISAEGPKKNRSYAAELARRGHVVIAPDYPNMGEYQKIDWRKAGYQSATMKGIFNHLRCVDLLVSLDEVDPDRLAVIGHSLGGHNSLFVAAFDPRLKAVVTSCGWTPFPDYYGGNLKPWATDDYMPLLKTRFDCDPARVPFDFDQLLAALAPRWVFSNSPTGDDNFDYRGVKKAEKKVRPAYQAFHAEDRFQVVYPHCVHDFPPKIREQAYEFIEAALGQQR